MRADEFGAQAARIVPLVGATVVVCALLLVGGAVGAGPRPIQYVDGSSAWCSDAPHLPFVTRPFCTIGAAAANLPAGGIVRVAAGTYRERVVVPFSGTGAHPLVFTAATGAVPVITGEKNGFAIRGRSWIRINGFVITSTHEYGIEVSDASHVTLSNNRVSHAGQPLPGSAKYGIRLKNVSESKVVGNTLHHNTNAGLALVAGSARNVVRGNRSFANAKGYERAAPGIRLYDAHVNTIDRNVSYDNEDSGIELDKSRDNLVSNNIVYRNGDHGVDTTGSSSGTRILANTIYDNVTAGINVEGGSTEVTVANNISVDNGIDSPRTDSDIRVDASSVVGTSLDYDLVSLAAGETVAIWNSVSYSSLATFKAATAQERHGIEAKPRWRDPAAADFRLTARSPAIDSANSLPPGQPRTDIVRTRRLDNPSTPNTGAGPRRYDDRGAYEFRPHR